MYRKAGRIPLSSLLAWTGLLLPMAWSAPVDGAVKRPNVILIVLDTVRADHLSAYGYSRATSPNLARLAAEGTLYDHAVAAAPWTLPSHASLFTGLPVRAHGTDGNHWTLEPRFDTLAEKLQRAGYRTAGFSNNVWTNDASGLKQGFEHFEELWRSHASRGATIAQDDTAFDMGAAKTNERILEFVDSVKGGQPFFVFVNYFEPHLPYRPTRPFDDDFLPAGTPASEVTRLRSFFSPREYSYILGLPTARVDAGALEVLTALYDGELAYLDSMVGKLVAALHERKQLDNTVLVITADHGEHLGEHHMLDHKFSLYEPLLHVPLIVRAPGRVAAGVRVSEPVPAHDLFGTVLTLAGAGPGGARTLPRGDRAPPSPPAVFSELEFPKIFIEILRREFSGWDFRRFERSLLAVRRGRYKLIAGSDGSAVLYDLENDPAETRDLATREPVILAELQKLLAEFVAAAPPSAPGASK